MPVRAIWARSGSRCGAPKKLYAKTFRGRRLVLRYPSPAEIRAAVPRSGIRHRNRPPPRPRLCVWPNRAARGASERKNRAGGKLVRGRHEGDAGILRQLGGIQAVAINWHRLQARSCGAKYFPGALVLRIFDGDGISAFDQDARDEIECLLRAVDDDYLRRIANDRARASHVDCNGFAQRKAAGRRTVVELANWGRAGVAQQDAPPHLERKSLDVAAASVGKIVAERNRATTGKVYGRRNAGGGCAIAR